METKTWTLTFTANLDDQDVYRAVEELELILGLEYGTIDVSDDGAEDEDRYGATL